MGVGEKQDRRTDGRQVRGSRVVCGYGRVAGGGLRRAGGPRGRCMGGRRTGLASWRSSGGQRIGLWARGSTGGRKEGLRVRGGATREDTEEERESTVDDSSLRRGDRDAGNCTSHVHNPQLALAREHQRAVGGLDRRVSFRSHNCTNCTLRKLIIADLSGRLCRNREACWPPKTGVRILILTHPLH